MLRILTECNTFCNVGETYGNIGDHNGHNIVTNDGDNNGDNDSLCYQNILTPLYKPSQNHFFQARKTYKYYIQSSCYNKNKNNNNKE